MLARASCGLERSIDLEQARAVVLLSGILSTQDVEMSIDSAAEMGTDKATELCCDAGIERLGIYREAKCKA